MPCPCMSQPIFMSFDHNSCHSPLAALQIAAVIATAAALSAPFAGTGFRLAVLLTLTSITAVTLCQYVGCCGAHGSNPYFYERMVRAVPRLEWHQNMITQL
jgi:hypothetical protein